MKHPNILESDGFSEVRGYANKIFSRTENADVKVIAFCLVQLCDLLVSKDVDEDLSLFNSEANHDQGAAVDRVNKEKEKRVLIKLLGLE